MPIYMPRLCGIGVMGYLDLSRVSNEPSESKATCTHDLCTMV
jgi:hypothetical protein